MDLVSEQSVAPTDDFVLLKSLAGMAQPVVPSR
jgi:hypothetical protein